ncbi:uncharacterized protein LOC108904002 [Anoplophora glabripennis]|uniref:uncharacterized protein LOC108904002 n=1 Tax=Anoplophora glabripennis TaxID=217634 RepID=UPI000874307D|nr:uncharacterized protein LOC108904002 [Anoplophora glabripennis]
MSAQRCYGVLLVVTFVSLGNSLECYNCSVTVTANAGDPCKGIGGVTKCQDPAVCLSATYSYEVPYPLLKQYITLKSCYLDMGGEECETFLKNIKTNNPSNVQIEFTEKCFTCQEKGCNMAKPQEPQSSTSTTSDNHLQYILLASLLCYLSTFL